MLNNLKKAAVSLETAAFFYYIFSGAETPIMSNAFFNVIWTALTSPRRALLLSIFFSIENLFCIVEAVEC